MEFNALQKELGNLMFGKMLFRKLRLKLAEYPIKNRLREIDDEIREIRSELDRLFFSKSLK